MKQPDEQLARLATWGFFSVSLLHNLSNEVMQLQALIEEMKAGAGAENLHILEETSNYLFAVVRDSQQVFQQQASEPEWFLVSALFSSIAALIFFQVRQSKVKFHWQAPAQLKYFGNRAVLHQMLLNLLRNSIEATADQPEETREIFLSANNKKNALQIVLKDSGPGFNAKTITSVPSNKPTGHGLGMSYVSHHLETTFRGSSKIISRAGQGTKITLHLPLSSSEEIGKTGSRPVK